MKLEQKRRPIHDTKKRGNEICPDRASVPFATVNTHAHRRSKRPADQPLRAQNAQTACPSSVLGIGRRIGVIAGVRGAPRLHLIACLEASRIARWSRADGPALCCDVRIALRSASAAQRMSRASLSPSPARKPMPHISSRRGPAGSSRRPGAGRPEDVRRRADNVNHWGVVQFEVRLTPTSWLVANCRCRGVTQPRRTMLLGPIFVRSHFFRGLIVVSRPLWAHLWGKIGPTGMA